MLYGGAVAPAAPPHTHFWTHRQCSAEQMCKSAEVLKQEVSFCICSFMSLHVFLYLFCLSVHCRPVYCGWSDLWSEPNLHKTTWRRLLDELHLLWTGTWPLEVWCHWWVYHVTGLCLTILSVFPQSRLICKHTFDWMVQTYECFSFYLDFTSCIEG